MTEPRKVTREEFDEAVEAVWTELQYQDTLPYRTQDEAKDVPGFLTLGRRYERLAEDAWADNEGNEVSLPFLRKLAGIYVRAMIYNGVRKR